MAIENGDNLEKGASRPQEVHGAQSEVQRQLEDRRTKDSTGTHAKDSGSPAGASDSDFTLNTVKQEASKLEVSPGENSIDLALAQMLKANEEEFKRKLEMAMAAPGLEGMKALQEEMSDRIQSYVSRHEQTSQRFLTAVSNAATPLNDVRISMDT